MQTQAASSGATVHAKYRFNLSPDSWKGTQTNRYTVAFVEL